MSGTIKDLPVNVCPFPGCRTVWIYDSNMYDDPDVCPKCGRIAIPPWEGIEDPIEGMVVNSAGHDRSEDLIYTATGGPLLIMVIAGGADFVRAIGY